MELMQAELVEPALQGTLNVLESCAKARPKRIVLTSSVLSILITSKNVPGAVIDESLWSEPDIIRAKLVRTNQTPPRIHKYLDFHARYIVTLSYDCMEHVLSRFRLLFGTKLIIYHI